jgi:serine/threonine protein kinase
VSLIPDNITVLLQVSGLVDSGSIVRGEFKVTDVSRRHRNLAVTSGKGRYFLKQGTSQAKATTLAHEAEVYRLLHNGAAVVPFARYLPRLISYDERRQVLVLEWIEDAQNLRDYHSRRGRFPLKVARTMGEALGTLHGRTKELAPELIAPGGSHLPPPWIIFLHRPGLGLFQKASGASLEMIKIVQQFPRFGELLDELREEWRQIALIHRDLKWDNCLFRTGRVIQGESNLKIIDWELAGLGDPCWDVGSVFNDYLNFWLLSIPATGDMAPADFLNLARYPLEKMHPALRAFWLSYKEQMQLDGPTEQQWQTRSVRYAAARLLQTAFEQMQVSAYLTGNVICSLQVSLNMLERPDEAAIRLLGLPPPGVRPQ